MYISVLAKTELQRLKQLAIEYIARHGIKEFMVLFLYRNKPFSYYEDIYLNHQGVMEKYMKDDNGDRGSAINGQIKGLFFSTKVDHKTGMPPAYSPFGDTRFNVPIDRLIHTNCRMWFADFYCNQVVHYVTVVITEIGTQTDQFCQRNLLELGMYYPNNPFIYYNSAQDRFYAIGNKKLWVEVLYTEDVDIDGELNADDRVFFNPTQIIGKGSSTPGGLPKNDKCDECNLYFNRNIEF